MKDLIEVTERTKRVLHNIYEKSFKDSNSLIVSDIHEFQYSILEEIIYLENNITALNFLIEKNNGFINDLVKKEIRFKDILKIYSNNVQKFKKEITLLKKQRYIFQRLADLIPFLIFPRHIIRQWLKLEKPGFLSFKTGLALELEVFKQESKKNCIKILCDITNCMRIGDVYFLSKDECNFIECKIRNSKNKEIEVDLSSIHGKIARIAEEEKNFVESDLIMENYSQDIRILLHRSYEEPVLYKEYRGIIGYQVVNWGAMSDYNNHMSEINKINPRLQTKKVIGNPSMISQILDGGVAPIFCFGFSINIILDLLDRQINLINYVRIDKLNQTLLEIGKNWQFDLNDYQTVIDIETNMKLGKILYPWDLLFKEFLTIDSFIRYCDYLISLIKKKSEL